MIKRGWQRLIASILEKAIDDDKLDVRPIVRDEVLYVGTSGDLHRRVRSYFTAGERRRRIRDWPLLAMRLAASPPCCCSMAAANASRRRAASRRCLFLAPMSGRYRRLPKGVST